MELSLILISIIILLLSALLMKSISYLSYWQNKGVQVPIKPIPILGNISDVLFLRKSLGVLFSDFYAKVKGLPFFGIYSLEGPAIILKDLDLIRTIMTKDFIHFTDHNEKINAHNNPISLNLFTLTGEAWKRMRVKLTPTFTTSKIKYMFPTVADCNIEMLNYLDKTLDKSENLVDFKDLFATLNTDVIGSCAFGVQCNSFKDPDSEFRKFGKALFTLTPRRFLLQLVAGSMPKFIKKRVNVPRKGLTDIFYKLVESTIKYREENNITRNDFMQLLINLRRDGSVDGPNQKNAEDDGSKLTIMEIVAQVFVFFIAGFETSSTAASFTLYELAQNPEVHDTLVKEIDKVLEKHGGEITYEAIQEMSYLSMVLDESLRKYPPAPSLRRVCTKEYTFPGTNISVEKNTQVLISILGIHRDPEIYIDPMRFDPERFTPENKASRHNFSYLPFGEGPRVCIGNRFGLMQSKLALVNILSKYRVSVCEKTLIPMKYDSFTPLLLPEGGVWLKVTPRTK